MCEKVNSKNPGTLQFISNHYKTQKMCEKTTDYYPHPLYVPDRYITQEMSKKIVSKKLFILKYFLDKYKTQEMCGKALEAYPSLLKVVFDWFITNKMLKYLDNSVFFNGNIVFFLNADSDNVTFFSDDVGFVNVEYNTVSLGHNNVDDDDPETIIQVNIVTCCNRYKQCKACNKKISKELTHEA